MDPKVSVLLPTKDRSDVLGRSIESVLEQTYSRFELIIIDSSSSDRSESVVDSFEDERIEYVRQEPNGVSAARNLGIERAGTEFIAMQDDDDVWEATKLERQMRVFETAPSNVGVVYAGVIKKEDDRERHVPGPGVKPKEGNIQRPLQYHNFVSPQTAIVRKRCFESVGGFDEELPVLEDWEIWLRIAPEFDFRYVDDPMVTAHLGGDSISRDLESLAVARSRIVRKHYDMFERDARGRQLFWSGHALLKTGHAKRGQKHLLGALKSHFRPLYLGAFVLSLFGTGTYRYVYEMW